jgi:imidazoleglycerol phosphate dehydratase HisB
MHSLAVNMVLFLSMLKFCRFLSTTATSCQLNASIKSNMAPRTAEITRDTKETKVHVILSLDGGSLAALEQIPKEQREPKRSHAVQKSEAQHIDIDSGIGFLDHMIHQLAKHGGWSLWLRCDGDLHSELRE